jgi:excisionase family DNA binding protein
MQTLIDSVFRQSRRRRTKMTKLSEYVKTAEAAEILGVAQNTLRKWAERGDLPMHRNPANGYRLFKRKDLDAFLRKVGKPVRSPKSISRKRPR